MQKKSIYLFLFRAEYTHAVSHTPVGARTHVYTGIYLVYEWGNGK